MMPNADGYGIGAASYQAAGELAGITQLVNAFYDEMERRPDAAVILAMHPDDLSESRTKLACFLSGWLGGPKLYQERYGGIRIPQFHKHLPIGRPETEAWLNCMAAAIDAQPYAESFKAYLLAQLKIPAARVQQVAGSA